MAEATIEDGAIVIRVLVSALPQVVEGAWATGNLETRYQITNLDEFAADLVTQLNREEEDGTTTVHRMFDKAIEDAIERGAFGVEEHEEQDA